MQWIKNLKKQHIIQNPGGYFKNCHASTLLKTGPEDFLCAYMAGEREGMPDMAIWLSACKNGSWQPPVRVQHFYLMPHWNPVLHKQGGEIRLYYKVGTTVQNWYTMCCVSRDGGAGWSAPQEAVPGDYSPRVCVRNKLLAASNGSIIGPCSIESGNLWDCYVDISDDGGAHWHRHNIPITHLAPQNGAGEPQAIWQGLEQGALWETSLETVMQWDGVIQPTLWESAPGRIHALMRSTRGSIYRADSADGGITWCEAYKTGLPNNNSGIDVVKLENGMLVLCYNPVSGNWNSRFPISLALSKDGGESWSEPVPLETTPGEYSYPAIISSGNRVYVSYTINRENIVFASFEVDAG